MLKRMSGFILVTCLAMGAQMAKAQTWTNEMSAVTGLWDGFLQKYVNAKGGVDYIGITSGVGQDELKKILDSYASIDPTSLNDSGKKALYINFYNAGMIYNILQWAKSEKVDVKGENFLTQLVNKISAPGGNIWNGKWRFKIRGLDVSLDDIEHGLIRGEAKGDLAGIKVQTLDARIHSAVNCAAYSCPRVRERAYRPETIDAMLDENMREWVNDPEQFAKLSDSKLKSNQIVFWYYGDFDAAGGAGSFISKFVQDGRPDAAWMKKHLQANFNGRSKIALKLSSAFEFFYDWRIADVRTKK
jgi:hypothetical protein